MESSGFGIGSYPHSHVVLAALEVDTKYFEISESKKILEDKLGMKVRSTTCPVGNYCCFDEEVERMVKDCDYPIGFSFNTAFEKMVDNINPFEVIR